MKKDLLNQGSDDNLIELRNVSKEFDGTTVLDNINLSIKKKEFVTLLGPSGCGKTKGNMKSIARKRLNEKK